METSQYLGIFIDESTEHLDTLYEQLLALEKEPTEMSHIEEIFRAAHTLKGMSATMGYEDLANLTHKLENIFDGIREDKIDVETEIMDVLFMTVDELNAMVEDIANGGTGERDIEHIYDQLDAIEKGEFSALSDGESSTAATKADDGALGELELDEFQLSILNESLDRGFNNYKIEVTLREDCLLKGARVYMVFEILEKLGEVIISNPPASELEEENFDFEFTLIFVSKEEKDSIKEQVSKVSEIDVVHVEDFSVSDYREEQEKVEDEKKEVTKKEKKKPKKESTQTATPSMRAAPTKTIRVNIERLDVLMNLFEELVIDRGRLEQISTELNHGELNETVERMSRISSDLQNIILTMRMVPIDHVFNRFPRMIRQLARELDKKVEIDIIGADTELDRTVIDEIGDPLVHLIRNAIDHGIEMPQERLESGKPESGTITLQAYHSGNHVFVEIRDDGAGINKEIVGNLAVERGVITEQERENMSDQAIYELILESGFSTNTEVSDVSGRGVGLDVVKSTIESLGGSISIDSSEGEGSIFSIQLPLTLSIISVLLIELQNEKYAIPLSSIIETAIWHKDDILNAHNNKVIDFRGSVVPLVFLNDIFEVPIENENDSDYVSIVIIRRGNRLTGLVVDSFIGQQEVVLKSLGNYLVNIFAISGATILGNGEVALIIDSNSLIS